MTGVILAAGKGNRLRPITSWIPKPLVPIGTKRLIDYTIDRLSGYVDRIVIVTGWLSDILKKYIVRKYRSDVTVIEVPFLSKGNSKTLLQAIRDIGYDDLIVTVADHLIDRFLYESLSRYRSEMPLLACAYRINAGEDEMKIAVNSGRIIVSKNLHQYDGVFLGVSFIPELWIDKLTDRLGEVDEDSNYETAFSGTEARCLWIDGIDIVEIDSWDDWKKAVKEISKKRKQKARII